jgi:hypothetical protein
MKKFLQSLVISLCIAFSAPFGARAAEPCAGPARASPGCISPSLTAPELAPAPADKTHNEYAAREAADKALASFEGGSLGYILVPSVVVVLAVVLILVLL